MFYSTNSQNLTMFCCLYQSCIGYVAGVFRTPHPSLVRFLPMAVILVSMTFRWVGFASAEEKPTLLDALKGLNNTLKTVAEKGNEVHGALKNGMVPVHSEVRHRIYRPPFYVKKSAVIVYVGPLCEPCNAAIQHLKDERIAHHVRDVTSSTDGKREYKKLGGGGVPILLFLGRRMDGFTANDFQCAKDTPKGREARCTFGRLGR